MVNLLNIVRAGVMVTALAGAAVLTGCATDFGERGQLPVASGDAQYSTRYRIAPGDSVEIFVWRNPEVSTSVPVRPDGLLSAPLLEEIPAAGKTPGELARDLEEELSTYLRDPLVTVIVEGFVGTFSEQIRVLGEASEPIRCCVADRAVKRRVAGGYDLPAIGQLVVAHSPIED